MAGGSPAQYQEVEGTEREQGARARWTTPADALSDDLPVWLEEPPRRAVVAPATEDDVAPVESAPEGTVEASLPVTEDGEPSLALVAAPDSATDNVAALADKAPASAPLSRVFARLLHQGGAAAADERQGGAS
jgi:hypothetical protein